MTNLPAFDPNVFCPKCRGSAHDLIWYAAGSLPNDRTDDREHIVWSCNGCGYSRNMLPLDAAPCPLCCPLQDAVIKQESIPQMQHPFMQRLWWSPSVRQRSRPLAGSI